MKKFVLRKEESADQEGARLPGFGHDLMHLSRWCLPGQRDAYLGFE